MDTKNRIRDRGDLDLVGVTDDLWQRSLITVCGVKQGTAEGRSSITHEPEPERGTPDRSDQHTSSATPADAARVRTLAPLTTVLFFVAFEVLLALLCLCYRAW